MDDLAVRLGVQELIAAYADCIDEDRLEAWPDFFTEQCRYVIISRADLAAGLRHGIIYAASRGMLTDRVMGLTRTLGGELVDPLKTTVVQGQRCMTTWVVRKT